MILAFDVPVSKEARELSEEFNVKIFTADIIYHLFDQFTVRAEGQRESRGFQFDCSRLLWHRKTCCMKVCYAEVALRVVCASR